MKAKFLVLLSCIALLAGLILFSLVEEEPLKAVLVVALLLLAAFPLFKAALRGSIDYFEPIYAISFSYFLFFGLRTVYILKVPPPTWGYTVAWETVDIALAYVGLGLAAMLLGYYSPLPRLICRRFPRLNDNISGERTLLLIYSMFAVSVAPRLVLIYKGWFMAHQSRVTHPEVPPYMVSFAYLLYLGLFAYALGWAYLLSRPRGRGVLLPVLCLLILPFELFWGFLVGSKHLFIPLLAIPLFTYNYLRQRVRLPAVIVPLLLFVFVVFPVVSAYRGVAQYGDIKLATIFKDLDYVSGLVADKLGEEGVSGYVMNSVHFFMERAGGIEALSTFIRYTPEVAGYQYGATIIWTPVVAFVPTALWENKNDFLAPRMRLVQDYFGYWRGSPGGLGITQITELYWNFGIFGIIAGMFILGVFYRTVYLYFMENKHLVGIFIYSFVWFYMTLIDLWFWDAYADLLKQSVILLALAWLITRGPVFRRGLHVKEV